MMEEKRQSSERASHYIIHDATLSALIPPILYILVPCYKVRIIKLLLLLLLQWHGEYIKGENETDGR